MRRRRLARNFRLEEELPKPERWARLVSLVFIPRKISELLAMQEGSPATMKRWRQSCGLSENTEWSRAIFTMSLVAIFAWTRSRLQFWALSFHFWKSGRRRGEQPRSFITQNSPTWD